MIGKSDALPLSPTDRQEIFKIATRGLVRHHAHEFDAGMSDEQLHQALADCLGTFGGSGGPDRLSVIFTGSGLRIWGGWKVVNHVTEKPLFSGRQTLTVAREIYGIANPNDQQYALL